jgi:hypothetical protein
MGAAAVVTAVWASVEVSSTKARRWSLLLCTLCTAQALGQVIGDSAVRQVPLYDRMCAITAKGCIGKGTKGRGVMLCTCQSVISARRWVHTTGCVRSAVLDLAAAYMARGLYSRHPMDACVDCAAYCLHVMACQAWAQVERDMRPGCMGAW